MDFPRRKLADDVLDTSEGNMVTRFSVELQKDILDAHKAWIEYKSNKQAFWPIFVGKLREIAMDLWGIGHALDLNLQLFKNIQAAFGETINPAPHAVFSRLTLALTSARGASKDMIGYARRIGEGPSADLSMFGGSLIGLMDVLHDIAKWLRVDYKPIDRASRELSEYFEAVSTAVVDVPLSMDVPGEPGVVTEVPYNSIRLARRVLARYKAASRGA